MNNIQQGNKFSNMPMANIKEEHIDFLLLEELKSSPKFQSWIVDSCFEQQGLFQEHQTTLRSVHDAALGESDLIFKFKTKEGENALLLIENKVNANFTNEQYKRYEQRGNYYIEKETCQVLSIVLIAPRQYLDNTSTNIFPKRISYEDIIQFYKEESLLTDDRKAYKIELLELAIDKKKRSGYSEKDDVVSSFQLEYNKLIYSNPLFNELGVIFENADTAPSDSRTARSKHILGDKKVSLSHNMQKMDGKISELNVQLKEQAVYESEFRTRYKEILAASPHISVVTKGIKSLKLQVKFGEINVRDDFESQAEIIKEALYKLVELKNWYLEYIHDDWHTRNKG